MPSYLCCSRHCVPGLHCASAPAHPPTGGLSDVSKRVFSTSSWGQSSLSISSSVGRTGGMRRRVAVKRSTGCLGTSRQTSRFQSGPTELPQRSLTGAREGAMAEWWGMNVGRREREHWPSTRAGAAAPPPAQSRRQPLAATVGSDRCKRPRPARPAGGARAQPTPTPPPACLAASAGPAGAATRLRAPAGRGGAWRPELGAGGAGLGRGWRRLRSSAGAVAGRLRGLGGETPREAVTSRGRLGRSVLVAAAAAVTVAAAGKERRWAQR